MCCGRKTDVVLKCDPCCKGGLEKHTVQEDKFKCRATNVKGMCYVIKRKVCLGSLLNDYHGLIHRVKTPCLSLLYLSVWLGYC